MDSTKPCEFGFIMFLNNTELKIKRDTNLRIKVIHNNNYVPGKEFLIYSIKSTRINFEDEFFWQFVYIANQNWQPDYLKKTCFNNVLCYVNGNYALRFAR